MLISPVLTRHLGWGEYLHYSLDIPVINKARAGRSARSYSYESRFAEIASLVKPEDFVIIEFGHNDGGSLSATSDNGRTDCAGAGTETCNTNLQKGILTYPAYLRNATEKLTKLGARVVIASPTPDNPWETGKFAYGSPRFTTYGNATASRFANAKFVDHGMFTANAFQKLGASAVDQFYPNDHTHTAPEGAAVVAQAFVRGVACSTSLLAGHVKNATKSIAGSCLSGGSYAIV